MKNMFICQNCRKEVSLEAIGTHNRNHCPFCLHSKHVDEKFTGDRKSRCLGQMRPIELMFKDEGIDKYGKKRQGEIMIIHECQECNKTTKNRIAGDDNPQEILKLAKKEQEEEVKIQLFGKR